MGEAIVGWSDGIWAIEQMPFGRSYTYCQQSQCTHLQCLLLQKLSLSLALKCILAQRIPAFTLHSSSAGPGAAVQYCSKNFDFHFCCAIQCNPVKSSLPHCIHLRCVLQWTAVLQKSALPSLHSTEYIFSSNHHHHIYIPFNIWKRHKTRFKSDLNKKGLSPNHHCTMGKLQWRDKIRNVSLLREIMIIHIQQAFWIFFF